MSLVRKLSQEDWYQAGQYASFVGHYHEGAYVQLYKPNWHNQSLDGLHFEVGISPQALAKKTVQIDLHVGHKNVFDRQAFNKRTVTKLEQAVSTWDGLEYRFSRTNLSERLNLKWPVTKSKFVVQLTAGFKKMDELSAILDEGFEDL